MNENVPVLRFAILAVFASALVAQPISLEWRHFRVYVSGALAQGRSGDRGGNQGAENASQGAENASQGAENASQSAAGSSASPQGTLASSTKGTPQAVVRQYALANDLKQGDLAKTMRSWNALNADEQAYLNNMNNPRSLLGLQISYIRENMNSKAMLSSFIALGGDPNNPPTEEDLNAAQALLAEAASTPGAYTDEQIAAAQSIVDQYNAWGAYQAAEALAEDTFMAASISYSGTYDQATRGDFREYVDGVISMKGLDTLVAEYDAANP